MKTILEIFGLESLTDDQSQLLELIDEEVTRCRNGGDLLGAGEWLISKTPYVFEDQWEEIFCKVIAFWASPMELKVLPLSVDDLSAKLDGFVPEDIAIALIATRLRVTYSPPKINDLIFRLKDQISVAFEVTPRRPAEISSAAGAKLEKIMADLLDTVGSFISTNCIAAKTASLEVVIKSHQLKKISLAKERSILGEIDVLLGPAFRKFCESCERQDMRGIIKRASDLRDQAKRFCSSSGPRMNSVLWNLVVIPIAHHVVKLLDEGSRQSEASTTPSLKLAADVLKLDLMRLDREMSFPCRLRNQGEGRALSIMAEPDLSGLPVAELNILDPRNPFEIDGDSEQIITFGMTLSEQRVTINIPLTWKCRTITGREHINVDSMIIEQQHIQPDWNRLSRDPPYILVPINKLDKLFGRDIILDKLIRHASAGDSTFLWGQKRVGKTSVIHVLADELRKENRFAPVVLRIGELGSLHEGQIAHRIYEGLCDRLCFQFPQSNLPIPKEEKFGAGLGSLIPFIEKLVQKFPEVKFIIIIDEFDDLTPAFYTGERGTRFIKALRSLSEIGITFFFVGSERMDTIFKKHAMDLNRWANVPLDYIESREDCKALITKPVSGAIEYQSICVDLIMDYCRKNPFYMHLLCKAIFDRCWQEKRTYVNENDLSNAKQGLVRALTEANFSHFWSDNPELDEIEKEKQSAENCLVLCCISALGGSFDDIDDLYSAQENLLDLGISEQVNSRDILRTVEILSSRRIISYQYSGNKRDIILPIFKDWLREYSQIRLLPRWREFCTKRIQKEEVRELGIPASSIITSSFPIPEDDLLDISQHLVYLGKQKDVSEIRLWLKQFDDDVRIEIIFLLLKRLAEKGFITEGARIQALDQLRDALQKKWVEIENRSWNIVKGRKENLCITFVDSEIKSGATTARDMVKILRPGKSGAAGEIVDWMNFHIGKDALILIIDDFAGTGSTLLKGLKNFLEYAGNKKAIEWFLNENRIYCYLLYSFPEALDKLRYEYPDIQFLATETFGDEVRAIDSKASIFEDDDEINFVKEVLTQIGRELIPQYPLGYGDIGALICFHNTIPNNTLPIFWSNGTVNGKPWKPLFPRA